MIFFFFLAGSQRKRQTVIVNESHVKWLECVCLFGADAISCVQPALCILSFSSRTVTGKEKGVNPLFCSRWLSYTVSDGKSWQVTNTCCQPNMPARALQMLLREPDAFSMWDGIFRHLGVLLPFSLTDPECKQAASFIP